MTYVAAEVGEHYDVADQNVLSFPNDPCTSFVSFNKITFAAISQAHVAASEAVRKEKQPVLSCDHCPMVWYHKLCADIESKI